MTTIYKNASPIKIGISQRSMFTVPRSTFFFILLVFLFCLPLSLAGQSCGNSITLRSQAEIDNFTTTYGTCTTISVLRLEGNDITNVDGLSNITNINNLFAQQVPNLENFDGFSNLFALNNLLISACPKVTNLDGFSSLTKIRAEFRLSRMTNLTSIEGLRNVTRMPRFRIFRNPKLSTCCLLYGFANNPATIVKVMYGNAGNCSVARIIAHPNTSTISTLESDGTANDGAICRGSSAQLSASGTFSFEWDADASSSATNIVTPSSNTNYSVTIRGCNNSVATKSATITVNDPVTTASAGSNQTQTNNNVFSLAANTPTVGTGSWSVVSGSASIANASSPTTTATLSEQGGSAVLKWTIANSSCSSSSNVGLFTIADQDNDGVNNATDQCPNTPTGVAVNAIGCASSQLDGDRDGVSDDKDRCPNTLSGATVGPDGCTDNERDSDGDGVPDLQDICANGDDKLDIDGDGTPDYCDPCNDLIDTDGDGTVDCYDQCPKDPLKTIKDDCGCGTPPQIDSDGDGIINCMDPCPYDLNQYVDGTLECGKTIKGSSRLGQRILDGYGTCSADTEFNGPELFYKLTVHSPTDLVIYYKEDNRNAGFYRTKLFVMNDLCTPESCIGSVTSLGETEVLTIPNAAAGDYFIAIDGRGMYDNANFELTVNCGAGGRASALAACGEENLIFEDFQSYEEGGDIAEMGADWELFGTSSQTAKVAMMDEETENMGLMFDRYKGSSDVSLMIGNENSGIWRVAWDMYIQPNSTAYFNIMGMKGTEDYGAKHVIKQADGTIQNRWINVEVFIDLDNNRYELMMDNRSKSTSGDYMVNLRKVNFYAAPYANFSIDNICVAKVESVPATTSRSVILEGEHLETKDQLTVAQITTNSMTTDRLKLTTKSIPQVLKVFPNPVKDVLTVQLPNIAQGELMIFDILGKQVWSQVLSDDIRQIDLNIAHFENGVYQLVIQQKDTMLSKKFIKQ